MHRFAIDKVWQHLKSNGFWEKYTCWLYHDETSSGGPYNHGQFSETGSTSNDPTTVFINDMFPYESGVCAQGQYMPDPVQPFPRAVNTADIDKYNKLLAFCFYLLRPEPGRGRGAERSRIPEGVSLGTCTSNSVTGSGLGWPSLRLSDA
ncbi:hypothetical protein ACLB2K_073535 [Fragaria x ananassa]